MRISCVTSSKELVGETPDIIVFPEGVAFADLKSAHSQFPNSIVVGAVEDRGYCRGILLHQGESRIDYLKVEDDGRHHVRGNSNQLPIYRLKTACIGVLICLDIQNPTLVEAVTTAVKGASSPFKAVCIPADMQSYWGQAQLESRFEGMHVILCNHTKTYPANGRCRSFVTDLHRKKIHVQDGQKPINANL